MTGSQFNFTKAAIANLQPAEPGRRAEYKDTQVPGLVLRVTPTGAKSFSWFRRTKNGGPERVTIGRFPEVTVAKARDAAAMHNALVAAGGSPATAPRVAKAELTFEGLFELYLERHAKAHKKTWAEDKQRFDQYLRQTIGAVRLSRVDKATVTGIHSEITAQGHPAVANRVLALVSSVFGRGIEWGYLDSNPAKGVRRNRERSRDRFMNGNELYRFFASVEAEANPVLRHYFLLSLYTGARRQNVLSMRWADIDFDLATWRIPETKNGEPQQVPLTKAAMDVLKERRTQVGNGEEFVLPGIGASGHLEEPKKAWARLFDRDELAQLKAAIRQAGGTFGPKPNASGGEQVAVSLSQELDRARQEATSLGLATSGFRMRDLRIHDLRRTLGSWQAIEGGSLQIIGKSLGHKSQAATAIYARLQMDPVRESLERATAAMQKPAS